MNSPSRTSRGQFFSFDVIAGSTIFLVAFFLLALYWLSAQSQLQAGADGMEREAQRIADQLMTAGPAGNWYEEFWTHPQKGDLSLPLDYYHEVRHIHLASDPLAPGEVDVDLMKDLNAMSGVDNGRFYSEVKEKLGIPRYDFYITIEGPGGTVLSDCMYSRPGLGGPFRCEAGREPASAREVANAEWIVMIDKNPGDSRPRELAKLRVQVWRA